MPRAHHPAGSALALRHRASKEPVGRAIEAVDDEPALATCAPMHERDGLGLRDRLAGLARDRLDELLELQRGGEPAGGRVQDLEIVDALLELMLRRATAARTRG